METRLMVCAMAGALLAALSLGPSFAHVLEAGPRLTVWPPELWRQTTVFNQQFRWFAVVGAPLDLAAIAMPAVLAFMIGAEGGGFRPALAASLLYAGSLAAWFLLVRPANSVLATWTPGPLPGNFEEIRMRWESGHMVVATLKVAGFLALILSLLLIERARDHPAA